MREGLTQYPDVNRTLDLRLPRTGAVLGANLVGLYL